MEINQTLQSINDEIPTMFDGKNFQSSIPDEDRENLLLLEGSPLWKTYRKYLMGMKSAHIRFMMEQTDPTVISKQLGIIVGLNLAINQVAFTNAALRLAIKKRDEEKKSRGKLS